MTKHLLSGHDHFRAEYFKSEAAFLKRLASEGQTPHALYIGCADSRVIPELLTSAAPGELFVLRNVANIIPTFEHADASVGAAVEYAIAKLSVRELVVCGHYGCGGVRAALDGLEGVADLPSLKEWLAGAEPAARSSEALGVTGDELFRAAVEENVLVQMDNLITYPVVKAALDAGRLALHGWVYDLSLGRLLVYDVRREEFIAWDQLPGAR